MARNNRLVWIAIAVALLYTYTWSWPQTIDLAFFKGGAVTLLAVHSALTVRGPERWPLTAVLSLGALGDMLLQWHIIVGAIAFTAGHVVAIRLYRRYRDENVTSGTRRSAWMIAIAATMIAIILAFAPIFSESSTPEKMASSVAFALAAIIYIMAVAGMAVSLWLSQFRNSGAAALGAFYFVVSDVLIIGRLGPLEHAPLINEVIWGLYIGAQVMICTGVIAGLQKINAYRVSQSATASMGSAP
jgi:uncharacterized membrane protein YhhN